MLFIATIICWEYLKYQKLKKNEEDKKLNPGISDRRLSIESETVDITMSCNSSSSVSSGSLGNATPATIEHDTTSAAVETASAEIPQDISIKKAEKSNIDSKNSGSFEKAEDVESNDELDDYPHDEIKTDIETPTTEDCKKITLTFSDYTDLQTRLLLLPRDDEDCKGAVISSYTSILENDSSSEDEIQKIANSNDEAGKNMSYRSIKVYPSLDESEGDRGTDFAEKSNLDEIEEKKSDSQHNDTTPSDQKSIKEEEFMRQTPSYEGYVLLSIGGIQKPESIGDEEKEEETNLSLGDTDFSDILASCREAPCPIQLNFISAGDYKALVLPPSPSGPSTLLDEKENQKKANNNNVSKTANVFSNRFSKWSSRVRASTSMIAQETASRVQLVADDIATKAKKNATKSNLLLQTGEQTEQTEQQTVNSKDLETHISKSFDKDEFLNNDDESDTSDDSEEINDPICALFLQTKSGELVKISNNEQDAQFSSPTPSKRNNRSSKRDLQITNSSILTIRNSDESYLSTSSYACQWFISKPLTLKRSTSAAVSSSFLSPNKQKHNMSSNSLVEMNTSIHSSNSSTHTSSKTLSSSITPNWIKIPDAIHPTFQPSTTEVGYRLKCEVYVNYGEGDSTVISSQSRRTVFAHGTQTVVSAESSLFNAARQNVGLMVNSGVTSSSSGAVFNNMRGYGKSEGRMFKVHVEMVPDNKTKNKILSKVSIFQFVGSTSEKMHDSDHPLCDCTAKASHNNPKLFNLVFSPEYQPDENSMLHLLCEQEDGENDDTAHQGRYLQLQAPNRISRESMLLSLGIANYKGKPSQLRNSTILFDNSSIIDSENHQVETKSLHVAASIPKEVPCIRKADSGVLSTESMEDVVISASLPNPDDDCSSKENNDLLSNSASSTAGSNSHNYQKLEADLLRMAKKLSQKDKYISDLEKKLSLEKQEKKRMSKDKSRMEDESSKLGVEYKECYKNLRLAEKRIESHESAVTRVRKDFNVKILELENKISGLEQDLSDKEKVVKSLQNDKAVLAAAVEARDSKLEKVNEMRETISDLKVQVENGEVVKRELADMKEAYESVTEELARKDDLSKRNVDEIAKLNSENVKEQETRKGLLKELEDKAGALMEIENENQKLKTQRNKYKQKADSLSKEMSRICKGGTLKVQDVEKMLDDRESMKSEIFALKKGKQNALREIDEYRTECSNLKRAQQLLLQNSESTHGGANSSKEFSKSLERSAELEKIIEDMTEYVQAKEMQIETMRDVNKTLMEEVTTLRQLVEFSNNTSFNV